MRIVIAAATANEWTPAYNAYFKILPDSISGFAVSFHETGVGMLSTTAALMQIVTEHMPNMVIQLGIAGCFEKNIPVGNTVIVKEEITADLGVEENGEWKDIFDLELEKPDKFPFLNKRLPNNNLYKLNLLNLDEVLAVTINEITTKSQRIEQLKKKYNPYLESMEGAALHYVCSLMNIPFLQIRSVSNYVGDRDKKNWNIPLAIENANNILLKYLHAFEHVFSK